MNKNDYKDFENQGWEAMFQTLDREMPVKKKRRGVLWFWLCLGMVATGSAFFYSKMPKQNAVLEQLPRASKEQEMNKLVFIEPSKMLENESAKKKKQGERNEIRSTNPIFLEEKNMIQIQDSSKLVKTQTIIAIEISDSIKKGPLSINQDSSIKTVEKPIIATVISPKKSVKKLTWGLTTGVHSQNARAFDGFQVGLIVGKPINTKWVVLTGLSLRQAKMTSQNTATYLATADKSSVSTSTPTLQKATSISINKLYYLEMPISLERKISKKFAFTAGLKLSYLLSQSTQKSDSSVYFVNNGSYSAQQSLVNDINASTLGLNRWDIASVGGLTFMPSRHIQLGLRYDFGLTKILSRTQNSSYNRYIGLNLNYLF